MPIAWCESLKTGVLAIDEDHRRLLELLELLEQARALRVDAAVIKETIRDLLDVFRAHFEREELLMEEVAYAQLADHRLAHKLMITAFGQLVAGFTEEDAPGADSVAEFLAGWLTNHIDGADRPLANEVRRTREMAG